MDSKKPSTSGTNSKAQKRKLENPETIFANSVGRSFATALSSTPNESFRQKCFDALQVHSSDDAGKKIGTLLENFKAKKGTNSREEKK
jgi:hypothetical protein